jgi:hypothetical protein
MHLDIPNDQMENHASWIDLILFKNDIKTIVFLFHLATLLVSSSLS